MRYLLNISFDGTNYYGTQKQPNKKTILGELEKTLKIITNEEVKLIGCSRLDKGVHANNYYFHVDITSDIEEIKLKKSLNSLIPDDIYVKGINKINKDFHARYNVKNKEYLYVINTGNYNPIKRNIELQYNKKINVKLLKKASKYLLGEHNFKSFTSDNEKENYVRTIEYIKIIKEKELIKIYIKADGFLKYMVRNIIGLFLDINEEKIKLSEIKNIIEKQDRRLLGTKALPNGLYLNVVNF